MFDVGPSGLNKQTLNNDSGCAGPDLVLNPAAPVGDGAVREAARHEFARQTQYRTQAEGTITAHLALTPNQSTTSLGAIALPAVLSG
ncbi:hypothetical protein [Streptomyces sp. NPDC058307]|uniref:hypothetical protein n=1 Tax=Streptomyces sp. NPDC058307 TaxID=3346439 RepID=UPI0036F0164C